MKDLKKGQMIIFSSMDDFTGQAMELQGMVMGDYKSVRRRWPLECAEADEGMFLVGTQGLYRTKYHAVHVSEVLHREQEQ